MSSYQAGIVLNMSSLITGIQVCGAVMSLLAYDWILCLDQEMSLIWRKRNGFTWASLVYVLNRYCLLVMHALSVMTIFPMTTLSCDINVWCQHILYALSQLLFCSFSTMRVLALSGMNRPLASVTFVLSIMPAVVSLTQNAKWVPPKNQPEPYNCGVNDLTPERLNIMFPFLVRGSNIIAECLVLVVTWRYTYTTRRIVRDARIGPSLTSVMFYNGSLYFLVIASFDAVHFGFDSTHRKEFGSTTTSAGLFADALSSILISRFILNLRQVHYDAAHQSDASVSLVIHFTGQVQSGIRLLPRSLASFAQPVHVDNPDPDMKWESDRHEEPSQHERAEQRQAWSR
ncbi:hypothetical protein BD310DRAFT_941279 [Dichomitus squalens]|uniref:DUF6533 domain-containing protein n=2 Tax=Dichomitus squalens TaxID=114155 RepID=A0A4Q9PB57_9APHY|nr:hypothetical protein BD310DRAFT_941279 [Dichomitus squalens]